MTDIHGHVVIRAAPIPVRIFPPEAGDLGGDLLRAHDMQRQTLRRFVCRVPEDGAGVGGRTQRALHALDRDKRFKRKRGINFRQRRLRDRARVEIRLRTHFAGNEQRPVPARHAKIAAGLGIAPDIFVHQSARDFIACFIRMPRPANAGKCHTHATLTVLSSTGKIVNILPKMNPVSTSPCSPPYEEGSRGRS